MGQAFSFVGGLVYILQRQNGGTPPYIHNLGIFFKANGQLHTSSVLLKRVSASAF
jgi:hypothetical protein